MASEPEYPKLIATRRAQILRELRAKPGRIEVAVHYEITPSARCDDVR